MKTILYYQNMASITSIYAKAPEDIPNLFAEAWNRRDAEGIAGLFAEDAEFINVVGLWWHDRQAIWKAHDYGLRTIFNQSTLEIRRTKVRQLSDEIAVVYARMRLSGQSAHGDVESPGMRQNIFSFVVQRKPEGWICVSAHNTDRIPGKETIIADEEGRMRSVDYREKSS